MTEFEMDLLSFQDVIHMNKNKTQQIIRLNIIIQTIAFYYDQPKISSFMFLGWLNSFFRPEIRSIGITLTVTRWYCAAEVILDDDY